VTTRPFRFSIQASHLECPEDLRPLAVKAEDVGVAVLTVADHLCDEEVGPLAALMAAADATTTLRVGSLVFSNDYRHPAVLAKEAATIDRLSGGRLEFGIARLDEALTIIKGLWSDGPFDFAGDHYSVTKMDGRPKPAQDPHPPVVIGGGGRKVLELAGRHADVVHLNPSLPAGVIDERAGATATEESTRQKLDWVRSTAGDRYEDLEIGVRIHLAIVSDERDELYDLMAGGFGLTTDQAKRSPHALCGTVEQIVDDLVERRELLGISAIGLSASALDQMIPVIDRLAGT
jgi:alkanesulfonate monooxygenase SsuD/methylene tetrahydromethanopterin reductase-like flavin-dependent oxidoreductase (luciferase family)